MPIKKQIPARNPKPCCKEHDEIPGQILQVPAKNRVQDLLDRIYVEVPVRDPFVRISVGGLVGQILCRFPSSRSLWHVSVNDLLASSLEDISIQDRCISSLYKDYMQDL